MNSAVVLLIEDRDIEHTILKREMKDFDILFLSAFTVDEARNVIQKNSVNGVLHISAIIVNACLGTHELTAVVELIREIRSRFSSPIIGTSEEESFQATLKRAGCSYVCDHDSLPSMLAHALGL